MKRESAAACIQKRMIMSNHVIGHSSILLFIHLSQCHLWIARSRLTLWLLVNVWHQVWRNSWFVVNSSTNVPTHQLEQQHFAVSPAGDNTEKADGPSHTSPTLVRMQQDCSVTQRCWRSPALEGSVTLTRPRLHLRTSDTRFWCTRVQWYY